jgi:hypothetical protein
LKSVVERQRRVIGGTIDARTFLVMDDCFKDNHEILNEDVQVTVGDGRCLQMFVALAVKHLSCVPFSVISNADFIFVMPGADASERRYIYENLGGKESNVAIDAFDRLASDKLVLVIDNSARPKAAFFAYALAPAYSN